MLNKKGFMSMSLVFSFIIVYVALIMALLANFAHNRVLLKNISNEIKEKIEKDLKTYY